jgi:hypothetical protein
VWSTDACEGCIFRSDVFLNKGFVFCLPYAYMCVIQITRPKCWGRMETNVLYMIVNFTDQAEGGRLLFTVLGSGCEHIVNILLYIG